MSKEFMAKVVADYLVNLGLPRIVATRYGNKGGEFFEKQVCNSRDPFKECCDHAGKLAEREIKSFKYKSPKAKGTRRNERPQEAFNFGN